MERLHLFPQKCGMEFQQKSVLFSLPQQELKRFPSFLHTLVSGTVAASDNSFVRRCHSHPSSFWLTVLLVFDHRPE